MKEKIFISTLFILATVIGTLSHELGHYFAALYYNLHPTLHFGFTEWDDTGLSAETINKVTPVVTLWGILVTVVVGTSGFLLTLPFKNKISNHITYYTFPVLAFFYSRQIFVFALSLVNGNFSNPDINSGDEIKLALLWGMNGSSISVTLAFIAVLICSLTVLLLPKEKRLTFLIYGFAGSVLGYLLWYRLLGPWLLP